MQKITKPLCSSILVISTLPLLGAVAKGGFITTLTATTTPEPGGLTLYSYALTTDPASTLNAEGLGISVSADANLINITGPTGWEITYNTGDTLVTWESSDPSTDLLPGQSAIFSFESPLGPAQQSYLATGFDTTGTIFGTYTGNVSGPGVTSVPEPSSLLLSGIGVLGVLITLARRSWRQGVA